MATDYLAPHHTNVPLDVLQRDYDPCVHIARGARLARLGCWDYFPAFDALLAFLIARLRSWPTFVHSDPSTEGLCSLRRARYVPVPPRSSTEPPPTRADVTRRLRFAMLMIPHLVGLHYLY